jgi:hypothetical protein
MADIIWKERRDVGVEGDVWSSGLLLGEIGNTRT